MLEPTISTRQTLYAQTLNRMGWSMLIFMVLADTSAGFSSAIQSLRNMSGISMYTGLTIFYGIAAFLCYVAPFFLTGLAYYILSRKIRTEGLSFSARIPREFPLLIFAGMLILTAAAYVNALFCSLIGYTIPPEMIVPEYYDDPSVIIRYLTVAVAPAFAEEFLFRGVFYANLRPFGRTQAILISAFLFALMHQNVMQIFFTFVAGIALALMYELTGSIWCSVFFHLFNNQLSLISEVLHDGKYGDAAAPYLSLLDGVVFLLGLISLVILIFYYKRKIDAKRPSVQGIYGVTEPSIGRREQPVGPRGIVKGLLTPGMVIFTALTAVLMLATWIMFMIVNGGVVW